MAAFIAVGNTAATSGDFTVVAGTPQALFLISAAAPVKGVAKVQIKGSNNVYFDFATVVPGAPTTITTPGVYRVTKPASDVAKGTPPFGVDKN